MPCHKLYDVLTGSINKNKPVSFSAWNVQTYIWQRWGCRGIHLRINIVMTGAREKGKRYEALSSRDFPAFYQLNICVGRTCFSSFQSPSASRVSLYGVGHKQMHYWLKVALFRSSRVLRILYGRCIRELLGFIASTRQNYRRMKRV